MKDKKLMKRIGLALLVVIAGIFYYGKDFNESIKKEDTTALFEDDKVNAADKDSEMNAIAKANAKANSNSNSNAKAKADAGLTNESVTKEISSQNTKDEVIYIHVCGAVINPGVYELTKDSRVVDAVALAGGFSDIAAKDAINQAQILMDGAKLYIPSLEEVELANSSQDYVSVNTNDYGLSSVSNEPAKGKVNINTADKETLMTLQGIGESKATSIISYREMQGAFESISDLQKISGIKEAVYNKIKDYITVN